MNISPISCSKFNFNSCINKHNYNTKALDKDVFIKTTSFGSSEKKDDLSFEAFEAWAKDTNFLEKALTMINQTAPILGSGFEGTTYEIPGCDRWVMKDFKRAKLISCPLSEPEVLKISDVSPNLNIGQFVASIKIPVGQTCSQHFYILKKQDGKSYGVQYAERDNVCESNVLKHKESLRTLASFPPESYKYLLECIEYVNSQGNKLDCVNPYNFMVDQNNQIINFVDANDKWTEEGFQYGDVLFALLDGDFAKAYEDSNRPKPEKDEISEYSKTICSKFLTAMVKQNGQFMPTKEFLKVYNSEAFESAINENSQHEKAYLMAKLGLC